MNWLISLVIAGVMFSSDSSLPANTNYNYTESTVKTIVQSGETERFEQTYPLNASGRVSVSNVNGSITIETWDRQEVKLEYVKTAESRERLSEVEIRIDAGQDYFQVETDYDNLKRGNNRESRKNGRLQVEYRLTVPRNALLDEIETVNGSINISNAANSTKASAVNGEVRATNLRGTANLSTVNGTVIAEFDRLETTNNISLDTVNGQVNLVIPSDASATIKADTLNGNIENDFGLPVRKGQYVGKDLYGKIGSGGIQIKLNSVNGGLSVKRKNDGKSANPATNLLPQKNKVDNEDDSEDENFDSVKMNKEIEKSIAKSNVEAAKAMKEAQKEIAKIKPQLEKINVEELTQAAAKINVEVLQEQVKKAQKLTLARMPAGNWFVSSPVLEKKSDTFAVKGTPKVTIEARNCAVSVRGWDKQEVRYSVTKISTAPGQKTMEVKAEQNGSDINIKVASAGNTEEEMFFAEMNRIRIEVFVPKKSNLKVLTNREIRLEGVSGEIDLQGGEEAVNVRDTDGKLSIGTSEGGIRVVGFRGAFDGKSGDGTMNLEGDFRSLNALASEGTIILKLPENANAILNANTEINFQGINLTKLNEKSWRIGDGGTNYNLQTTDGQIFVRAANIVKEF